MRKEDCINYEWTENQKKTCSKDENNLCECVLFSCETCKDFE